MADETAVDQFQKAALEVITAMSAAAVAMVSLVDMPAAGSTMENDYQAFKAKSGAATEEWAKMIKAMSTAWGKPSAPAGGGAQEIELAGPAKTALSKVRQVDGIPNANPAANPPIQPVLWPGPGQPLALTFSQWVDEDSCLVTFAATVPEGEIEPIPFGYVGANSELKPLGVVKIINTG